MKKGMIGRMAGIICGITCAAGCAVGPDFHRPPAMGGSSYVSTPVTATDSAPGIGGAAQTFHPGEVIPAQWWSLFQSKELDAVIRAALAGNPTLESARASLRAAQEDFNARAGTEYAPDVSLGINASRNKTTPTSAGLPPGKGRVFNLLNASVLVTYDLDVSGGGRRELEALSAKVGYQRFQLEAAYLTLTSNVVTAAIREASLRELMSALQELLTAEDEQMALLEKRFALGGVSRAELLAQKAEAEQTRALLPPYDKALAAVRHQLAVLTGHLPSEEGALPAFTLSSIQLPGDVPLSVPSSLARRRPDIRAAEELLRAANASVGIATADMYPQITLTGEFDPQLDHARELFRADRLAWNISAGLLQPIFNGGSLRAKKRSAMAAYDQALAQYRDRVLTGFREVADALRALQADARTLQAQVRAEQAARDSLEMSRKQYEAGAVSYTILLNAQKQRQQARISLIQAQADRFADTAALFQALGGGWDDGTSTKKEQQ